MRATRAAAVNLGSAPSPKGAGSDPNFTGYGSQGIQSTPILIADNDLPTLGSGCFYAKDSAFWVLGR